MTEGSTYSGKEEKIFQKAKMSEPSFTRYGILSDRSSNLLWTGFFGISISVLVQELAHFFLVVARDEGDK